jgi:tetratricopeptide (TPR) repeat protein
MKLEAQIQSYHYACAIGQLAEVYARVGRVEEAFKCFEIMRAIYLPEVHPQLIEKTYAQDKCAHIFSFSALWYLQIGQMKKAITRCELVLHDILPEYNQKDLLGLFHILMSLLRVFKWSGRENEALKLVEEYFKLGLQVCKKLSNFIGISLAPYLLTDDLLCFFMFSMQI